MLKQWITTLAVFAATSSAAFAQQAAQPDRAASINMATFCGAEGYETTAQYSDWLSVVLNQAESAGLTERDALAALNASHCRPAMWTDMTPMEAAQFCGDGELSPSYSTRLNEALDRAREVGLETPEAMMLVRSVHCHEPR